MRYLGIDYGSKNIGLAISDLDGKMAFPFKVIKNDEKVIDVIHNICGEEEIFTIVIGKPEKFLNLEEFKKNLEFELKIPIVFEKEFMTSMHSDLPKTKSTFIARKLKKFTSSNKKDGGKKNKKDDSKAATLILQRFLDRQNK